MKKNVAGQKIGAQMVSASDGSAFTGAVTIYVTGDAGTQAVGSVGSGACAHEGNGYHTYAPAQAESNYDLIAFTFIGTGAVPVTLQVFTGVPQTGDNFAVVNGDHGLVSVQDDVDTLLSRLVGTVAAGTHQPQGGDAFARLGAPTGASISADVVAVKGETAETLTRLPDAAPAAAGGLPTVAAGGLKLAQTVDLTSSQVFIKKNVAFADFDFLMVDSAGAPKTGLTVTAQRRIDNGSFAVCANSVVEVAYGLYAINLAASDVNGTKITLRFSATAASDRFIELVTQA